jgi:hypothetical protein
VLAAPAAASQVELELVLAIDVSASVNDEEFALQRAGTAAAFRDPQVQQAVERSPGGIVVTVFQWASQGYQRVAIPWRHLEDAAALEAYAGEVAQMPRLISGGGTMIHTALAFAQNLFASSPLSGRRRVIDLAGNGEADDLPALLDVRDRIVAQGTVINALAIEELQADLTSYFRVNLIGGPGAFVETAEDFHDFVRAMRLKLLREIGDRRMSRLAPSGQSAD